jgi:bacteriocin biosynthesis cyclodehydratase domain-containing protein
MPTTCPIVRPAFKARFHLEAVDGEGFFLVSENEAFVLEGPNLHAVVPLIDGFRSTHEIVQLLRGGLSETDVIAAVEFLSLQGHICESDPYMPPHLAAFWSAMDVDTRQVPTFLGNVRVQLIALDGDGHIGMGEALRSFGVTVTDSGQALVVTTDDYLDPRLHEINRNCIRNRTPWLLLKPNGTNIWLGPIFNPGNSACWRCLQSRLNDNREIEKYIQKRNGPTGPLPTSRSRVWATRQQAYSTAAVQFVRWLVTGNNQSLASQVVVMNSILLETTTHPVVRRPQCPDCGDAGYTNVGGRPIQFQNEMKSSVVDGGERREPPEITFEKYRHHISPITGIVRGVYPSPYHSVTPLRTYVAGHNFALINDSLYFLKDGLRTHSSGKGKTDAQARTSALCEALERYSGVHRGEESRVTASYRELADSAIHPNNCMLYSETQYREREDWLKKGGRFQVVPLPFDENASLEWSPLYSMTERRIKYLPTGYLYYGYPYKPEHFFCWADSNGNASGTTLEDACLQAFYEIVERDSVCIWWYNQIQRQKVDLKGFNDPYVEELEQYYASLGREFWVLDISSDLDIPAFVAINARMRGPTQDIVLGFGAHMDVQIGVMRAVTEMNQFMPAVLNVAPNGETHYAFQDAPAIHWWRHATVTNQSYLRPPSNMPNKNPSEYPKVSGVTLLERLQDCFSYVEREGMEVLILDQTRPDVGIPVVKVVVPGMRHFWARYAPGRLYDVPVKQGLLTRKTDERHLNPTPMFL